MDRLLISVSGYGATGSSAINDLFYGSNSVEVLDDFEFQIHYFPDAIRDLDYKLNNGCARFYDSDVAIVRFLDVCKRLDKWYAPAFNGRLYEMANAYIEDLRPIKWQGYWAYDRLFTPQEHISEVDLLNSKIEKINGIKHHVNRAFRKLGLSQLKYDNRKGYYQKRTMYQCLKPDNFILKTQQFTDRLLNCAIKTEKHIILVNQLLPPHLPFQYYKYFSCPVKTIVVTRDPRDLYIHIKRHEWQVLPYDDVRVFVEWYKQTMNPGININDGSILFIPFEDLVYELDESVKKLVDFMGLDTSCDILNSKFDPHKSVANTQHFSRFKEYSDDVKYIEQELPAFLYDFKNHKTIECFSDKIF